MTTKPLYTDLKSPRRETIQTGTKSFLASDQGDNYEEVNSLFIGNRKDSDTYIKKKEDPRYELFIKEQQIKFQIGYVKFGYTYTQNLIPPYILPFGGKDWHYIVNRNFTAVRIYLDIADITNEQMFVEEVAKDKLQTRNTIVQRGLDILN